MNFIFSYSLSLTSKQPPSPAALSLPLTPTFLCHSLSFLAHPRPPPNLVFFQTFCFLTTLSFTEWIINEPPSPSSSTRRTHTHTFGCYTRTHKLGCSVFTWKCWGMCPEASLAVSQIALARQRVFTTHTHTHTCTHKERRRIGISRHETKRECFVYNIKSTFFLCFCLQWKSKHHRNYSGNWFEVGVFFFA